jgi:hypothetical protein
MKIIVPEGMLKAATQGATNFDGKVSYPPYIESAVIAALRWLSENPIVPTDEQISADAVKSLGHPIEDRRHHIVAFQRRMFLPREPEVPEEIRGLFVVSLAEASDDLIDSVNDSIVEAFRLGQQSAAKGH